MRDLAHFLSLHGGPMLFWAMAVLSVGAAVMVVATRNPVHSALFLLVTFLAVAGIFIQAGAEFLGAVQILVYAGGIMVLFLFVIMLVNVEDVESRPQFHTQAKLAGVLAVLLVAFVGWGLVRAAGTLGRPADPRALQMIPSDLGGKAAAARENPPAAVAGKKKPKLPKPEGNSAAVGMVLYGRYAVPFELASILLLVAMIGAIVMGKKRLEGAEVDR